MGGSATATGAKLGRYQIVKHLASGGMAEVLLARATGIEGFTRHVVIKRIRPQQAKDAGFVQMFLNEARLAAQLHHANIVQVHDIGQEGSEYFFAMEYVHGEDLRRLLTHLAREKLKCPLEHLVTIISSAAVALHHAHDQLGPDRKPLGIVHRDVTPANILVGYDGNVKVVDFGIAKAALKTEETQAGTLKGKASYMSPEQCTGSKVDRRSDVFALGIVLYELATTRRLFKAENDFLTMSAIVAGKIPPPRTHRPDLPEALEAIIMKALALEAGKRFQSCDEMREALEQFAANRGLRTSTSGLASYMKQQFGERPEPWLVEDDEVEMEMVVDFDGSASAIVSPPEESLHQLAMPKSVEAINSSPIAKARTKAISTQPPNVVQAAAVAKKQLPPAPQAKLAKPLTAQIPVMGVPPSSDKSKPFRIDAGPLPAAPRRKPITVQIPTQNQVAGAKPVAKEASGGVPKDVDTSWDPSQPITMGKAKANESGGKLPLPAKPTPNGSGASKPVAATPVVENARGSHRRLQTDADVETNVLDVQPKVKIVEPAVVAKPKADPTPTPYPTVTSRKTPALGSRASGIPATPPPAGATPAAPKASANETPPPLPPVLPANEPKTWSLEELASMKGQKPIDKNDQSTTSKFDMASLSSSRTDVSGLQTPIVPTPTAPKTAADALAAADAEADAADKKDGRDSAPSLPPPPVGRKSVKLPGVAQTADQAGSVAAKFAAPSVFTATTPPSNMPDTWAGGSSLIRTPSFIKKLIASPKRIAITAGSVVVLVAVIVFATSGSSKQTSPAPAKANQIGTEPTVAPPTQPTTTLPTEPTTAPPTDPTTAPPTDPTTDSTGAAVTKPATKPTTKPATKTEPKKTTKEWNSDSPFMPVRKTTPTTTKQPTKPATKTTPTKKVTTPATKPTTKPATKKSTKKWDPNTLFPTRK